MTRLASSRRARIVAVITAGEGLHEVASETVSTLAPDLTACLAMLAEDPARFQRAAVAEPEPSALADRGVVLFGLFTVSALAITAIVVLVGAIARWWILIPVMAVDFAVTATVLTTVARLLDDSDA